MARLARPFERLQRHYDAVVVGSGYGAGVAASRLARAGKRVTVLERGREFLIGEFPSRFPDLRQQMQVSGARVRMGSPTGLYDVRLGEDMHVPHALDVDGQTITMFDPVNHQAAAGSDVDVQSVVNAAVLDRRWQPIRRPVVVVGGELTLDMLDLTFNPIAKFYEAPIQLKANGGVFVVDDFGRQRIPPRDLLNRWIVPLESRVDFLTLQTGQKLPMPFVVLVVFATNIKPSELVDEAFLRRIHYKVYAESPSLEQYKEIFRRACSERRVPFDESLIDHIVAEEYEPRNIPLRGCHPRDLLSHVLAFAEYFGETPRMTAPLLKMAFETYFVDERPAASRKEG